MAEIVFGFGTSHGPLLATPSHEWDLRANVDRKNKALAFGAGTFDFEQLYELRKGDHFLVREQNDRLGHVLDFAFDEERLILRDQIDSILCGNVAIIADGEAGRVEIISNGSHSTARNCRADRTTVKHARKYDVVGVARRSGRFSDSVFSRDARTYCGHRVKMLVPLSEHNGECSVCCEHASSIVTARGNYDRRVLRSEFFVHVAAESETTRETRRTLRHRGT